MIESCASNRKVLRLYNCQVFDTGGCCNVVEVHHSWLLRCKVNVLIEGIKDMKISGNEVVTIE